MNKLLSVTFSLCLVFFTYSISGQDLYNSETIVGKWYLLASKKIQINDTISLVKNLPKSITMDYSQWEFTKSNLFLTTNYKHLQSSEFVAVMENKKSDDIWSYDKVNGIIIITNNSFKQKYYLLLIKPDFIKLVRIE
ncbi:MAG TPA: hypothetical protein VK179_11045 [Bacteroidales bacterium]|nr:hypothetical protein [Bacteroidales bacterium]